MESFKTREYEELTQPNRLHASMALHALFSTRTVSQDSPNALLNLSTGTGMSLAGRMVALDAEVQCERHD